MSTDELIKRLAWGSGIAIVLAIVVIYATSSVATPDATPTPAPRVAVKPTAEKIDVEVVQTPAATAQPEAPKPAATSNRPKAKTIFE